MGNKSKMETVDRSRATPEERARHQALKRRKPSRPKLPIKWDMRTTTRGKKPKKMAGPPTNVVPSLRGIDLEAIRKREVA